MGVKAATSQTVITAVTNISSRGTIETTPGNSSTVEHYAWNVAAESSNLSSQNITEGSVLLIISRKTQDKIDPRRGIQ